MTSHARSILTAAAVTAILVAAPAAAVQPGGDRPASASGSPAAAPAVAPAGAPEAAPAVAPAGVPEAARAPATSSGTVLWANAGVEHLRHPASAVHRARLFHGLMRGAHATLGLLAETNGAQLAAIRRVSHGRYGVVPGRRRGETNAVVYDTGRYRLERIVRFRSFAYRGHRYPVAVALLRDRTTGALIAALAVHHPASNTHRGGQGRWQRASWRNELRALAALRSSYDGRISTLLGGDFNQQQTCRLVARTGLVSPIGTVSSCPTARPRIDQLFADRSVAFTGYYSIRRGAARRATDHAGVYVASFRLTQPA